MISREEAMTIITQVPLYRYECELDKSRQSDLFKALNKAITDMQKLEKLEQMIDDCRFKIACIDKLNEAYNQALEDFVENISLPMTEEQIGEIAEKLKR